MWNYRLGKSSFMSSASQPILVVSSCAMRCLNTYEIATRKVTSIYKTQKSLQKKIFAVLMWANSCINTVNLSYCLHLTIIFKLTADVLAYNTSRPVTSLGHQVRPRAFWEGTKFFKLCPIILNYVQHIFPRGANNVVGGLRPPRYGPEHETN